MTAVLPVSTKLSYGLGQFAWSAKDVCFHYFLFFYYTQLLGLSASLAGLAALLALIADGFSDPIIGQLSDNFRGGKWGRRHPFMIAAVVPFCLSLIAIFNPPAQLSQFALLCWYLGWAIALRTLLTLFTVPHMALGAELSEDYTERTTIAAYRNIVAYIGGIAIQVIAFFVLIPAATEAGNVGDGYRNVGTVAAAIALMGMLAAILGTRSRIPHLVQTSPEQKNRLWYLAFKDILSLFKIPSARVMLFGNVVIVITMGVGNTILLHVNSYYYGFSSVQIGTFMLVIALALLPAATLSYHGTRLFGKPRAVVALLIGTAAITPLPVMLHLYGIAPPSGSTGLLVMVCCFLVVQQSMYIAFANVVAGMVPDIADESELHTGLRQEGMLNSAMMLTQKLTFGIGALIAGFTIDYVGLEGVSSAAQMTEEMSAKLGWVFGPGIACGIFLGAVVFSFYGLNSERYAEIRRRLDLVKS